MKQETNKTPGGWRRKTRVISLLLCIVLMLGMLPMSVFAEHDSVSRDVASLVMSADAEESELLLSADQQSTVPDGYIGIYTKEDLDAIRENPRANYILMDDLFFLGDQEWTPIENFYGVFDGNGYSINGLDIAAITKGNHHYAGLFANISSNAVCKNLSLYEVKINLELEVTHNDSVSIGAICGNASGSILNCCVDSGRIVVVLHACDLDEEPMQMTSSGIGGISGNAFSSIDTCWNNCDINVFVSPTQADGTTYTFAESIYVAGICGSIDGSIMSAAVSNCANYGRISLDSNSECQNNAGGIVGRVFKATVTSCTNKDDIYASGNISSTAGGIAGFASSSTVRDCVNLGDVTAFSDNPYNTYAAGIVATTAQNTTIDNCVNYCEKIKASYSESQGLNVMLDDCVGRILAVDFDSNVTLSNNSSYYQTLLNGAVATEYIGADQKNGANIDSLPEEPVDTLPTIENFTLNGQSDAVTVEVGDQLTLGGVVKGNGSKIKAVQVSIFQNGDHTNGGVFQRVEPDAETYDLSQMPPIETGKTYGNLLMGEGVFDVCIYATLENGSSFGDDLPTRTVTVTKNGSYVNSCKLENPVSYAGNYRTFTVEFSSIPTSAYLQFDNPYDASQWLDSEYCKDHVLFKIDCSKIVQDGDKYLYETSFRIYSEGLESNEYSRKVRVVANYSGTEAISESTSFTVLPIPEGSNHSIGQAYEQAGTPEPGVESPVIKYVTKNAAADGSYVLTVIGFDCDASAAPFFWWTADNGTFYQISDDYTKVGFEPEGICTVTVYMGDGLGYVTSYELTVEG